MRAAEAGDGPIIVPETVLDEITVEQVEYLGDVRLAVPLALAGANTDWPAELPQEGVADAAVPELNRPRAGWGPIELFRHPGRLGHHIEEHLRVGALEHHPRVVLVVAGVRVVRSRGGLVDTRGANEADRRLDVVLPLDQV